MLSDGAGLEVSDGDGEGELVVVLGLVVVGAGVDDWIDGADDPDSDLNGVAVGLHDGEDFGELDAEERGDRDAEPSVVPWPCGRPPEWELPPVVVPGATPLVGEMVDDTLCRAT